MKKFGRALIGLFLIGASPAYAINICDYQPPYNMREEPNINYKIIDLNFNNLKKKCNIKNEKLLGCSKPTFDSNLNPIWIIYVKKEVDKKVHDCIVSHEKGHLPPNNWRH
jgi:hypothetical protein